MRDKRFKENIDALLRDKHGIERVMISGFDLSNHADLVEHTHKIYLRLTDGQSTSKGPWHEKN